MMSELKIMNYRGKKVVDSRDVAAMVERNHSDLMKSIRSYAGYLNESEIPLVDFFVESTYVDSKGETRPNYLITKKGCDMIANKLTGKKGVLFTAAYVTAFEDMREALANPPRVCLPEGVTLNSLVGFLRLTRRAMLDMGCGPTEIGAMICHTCAAVNFPIPPALEQQIPGQMCLYGDSSLAALN